MSAYLKRLSSLTGRRLRRHPRAVLGLSPAARLRARCSACPRWPVSARWAGPAGRRRTYLYNPRGQSGVVDSLATSSRQPSHLPSSRPRRVPVAGPSSRRLRPRRRGDRSPSPLNPRSIPNHRRTARPGPARKTTRVSTHGRHSEFRSGRKTKQKKKRSNETYYDIIT